MQHTKEYYKILETIHLTNKIPLIKKDFSRTMGLYLFKVNNKDPRTVFNDVLMTF